MKKSTYENIERKIKEGIVYYRAKNIDELRIIADKYGYSSVSDMAGGLMGNNTSAEELIGVLFHVDDEKDVIPETGISGFTYDFTNECSSEELDDSVLYTKP